MKKKWRPETTRKNGATLKSLMSRKILKLNKMKKTILFVFTVIAVMLTFNGCKKGENDPFLSLKSRNARITATWKLSKQEYKKIVTHKTGGTTVIKTTTRNFDGSLMTVTTSIGTTSNPYSWEITIEKDGTYSMTKIEAGYKTEQTGNWWWLDDKNNKARIVFDIDNESYKIDQLKSKELILTQDYTDKDTNSDGDFYETKVTSTMTFTKK